MAKWFYQNRNEYRQYRFSSKLFNHPGPGKLAFWAQQKLIFKRRSLCRYIINASATTGNVDIGSYFNDVDFGLDAGLGIKFPVSDKTKLFFEVNGQRSLSNIFINNYGSSAHNSLANLNIGLKF